MKSNEIEENKKNETSNDFKIDKLKSTIEKIEISNFLSIEKISVNLSEKMNIAIGKNESGKSNFFKALKTFNNKENDYASLSNRDLSIKGNDIKIKIDFQNFSLEETLKKFYKNSLFKILEIKTNETFYIEKIINEKSKTIFNSNIIQNLNNLDKINEDIEKRNLKNQIQVKNLSEKIKKNENILNNWGLNIKELYLKIDRLENNRYFSGQKNWTANDWIGNNWESDLLLKLLDVEKTLTITNIVSQWKEELKKLENNRDNAISKIQNIEANIEELSKIKPIEKITKESIEQTLLSMINFEFDFWEYSTNFLLSDEINILEFKTQKENLSKPLYNIFSEIINEHDTSFDRLMDMSISNKLPDRKKVSKYIKTYLNKVFQNHWNEKNYEVFKDITFDCNISNGNFEISIQEKMDNQDDETISSFRDRSEGFKRMASIILSFGKNLENKFILMDEVETHIHIDGQIKLLELLYKISQNNQMIFSTLSPFMISDFKDIKYLVFKKNKMQRTEISENKFMNDIVISSIYGFDIWENFNNPEIILIFEGELDANFFKHTLIKGDINLQKIKITWGDGAHGVYKEIKHSIEKLKNSTKLKKIITIFDNDDDGKKGIKKIEEDYELKDYQTKIENLIINKFMSTAEILEDLYPKEIKENMLEKYNIKFDLKSSFNSPTFQKQIKSKNDKREIESKNVWKINMLNEFRESKDNMSDLESKIISVIKEKIKFD